MRRRVGHPVLHLPDCHGRQVFDPVDRIRVFRQGRIMANLETCHTHPEQQIVGLTTRAIDPVRLVREPVATP